MDECSDTIRVEVPRVRCPDCHRDYQILCIAHTCGEVVKCRRPSERYREAYIPVSPDEAQSAQCEQCKAEEELSHRPKKRQCPGCDFVGYFTPAENGKCVSCNAPKPIRGRRGGVNLPPTHSNDVEYNVLGASMHVEKTPAPKPSTHGITKNLLVRFHFCLDTIVIAGFTDDDIITIYDGGNNNYATISDALNSVSGEYIIKMLPPQMYNTDLIADMKFLLAYREHSDPNKYPINFY